MFNDDAYGAEVNIFDHQTDKLDTVRFPETDIAAIARGYGCDAISVRSIADLEACARGSTARATGRWSSTRRSPRTSRG